MGRDQRRRSQLAVMEAYIKAYPAEALGVLLETGALEQFSDCGHCVGREDCRYADPHLNPAGDMPECVPVYRLVPKTEETQ